VYEALIDCCTVRRLKLTKLWEEKKKPEEAEASVNENVGADICCVGLGVLLLLRTNLFTSLRTCALASRR
jgi:hypothetical protein